MSRLLNPEEAAEYKNILDNYELHDSVLEDFQNSNFAVIAGPAGAGKDTLRDNLVQNYPDVFVPILSTTTRPPRSGEEDGVTYHFKEVEDVRAGLENRIYFQADLVHNQQISTLNISEINKLKDGQFGLSILIVDTEKKLRDIKPDIKTIFLIPPDVDTLISRMQSERLLDASEIDRRLEAAKKEIKYALDTDVYYCLVSDTVENVVVAAYEFLINKTQVDDSKARKLLAQIYDEINN